MLIQLNPRVQRDKTKRKLYMSVELANELDVDRDDDADIERFQNLIADLEIFIISPTIDPRYLTCLEPTKDGVWEIRSYEDEPQIRVFGVFATKDVFVCTHFMYRPDLADLEEIDPLWKNQVKRTKANWRNLFPAHSYKKPRNLETEIHKLFTGAINAKYFR